jgi:hypothetical protein
VEFDLTTLGTIAVFVPGVAGIVKQTVDIVRGSFGISPQIRVILNYTLSFFLMAVLLYATNNLVQYQDLLKAFLAGWIAANLAASINATHKESRETNRSYASRDPRPVKIKHSVGPHSPVVGSEVKAV